MGNAILSSFQVKEPHLFFSLALVGGKPVAVDGAGALGGLLDFVGAAVAGQPLHQLQGGGVRGEIGAVERVLDPDATAFEAAAYEEHGLVRVSVHAFPGEAFRIPGE